MEGIGMKFDNDISFTGALPDAPLSMPKQTLERRRSLISSALRSVMSALPWF
jgi:hypothetical protein